LNDAELGETAHKQAASRRQDTDIGEHTADEQKKAGEA
jgi:hypothetical protein